MNKVTFTFKNGKEREMHRSQAKFLALAKQGSYMTRDMRAAEPAPVAPVAPAPAQAKAEQAAVDLDKLDADALHALAQERGVKVHHKAGADKVREALRQAD